MLSEAKKTNKQTRNTNQSNNMFNSNFKHDNSFKCKNRNLTHKKDTGALRSYFHIPIKLSHLGLTLRQPK